MKNTRKLIGFDWAMKRILRNKANFAILEGFLSELLQDDITITQILESESNQENETDRSNRVDLLVENHKKELIIVEIQQETEYDFLQRMLYGVSKALVERIKKGSVYGVLCKVISIGILYFDLGQGEDYAYRGTTEFLGLNKRDTLKLSSRQQELYHTQKISDIFPEYYLLKINQFDDHAQNTLDEWIYFLKNEEIEDSFTARGLKEAREELDILKLSPEERKDYENYLESLRYKASMFQSHYTVGVMDGKKEGIAIGKNEEKRKMTRKLKELGVNIQDIAQASDLPIEEIAAL